MRPRIALALLALACAVRLITVLVTIEGESNPYRKLQGDPTKYSALAVSLARGEGFSSHYDRGIAEFFRDPEHFRPLDSVNPTASKPPGYPLFLAAIFRIAGYRLIPILVIQALVGAASTLLVYVIARELGLGAWALVCYAIAVLYYPFWYEAALISYETLLTFLVLLSLWCVIRWLDGRSIGMASLTGLIIGFTTLVKPVILMLVAVGIVIAFIDTNATKTRAATLRSITAMVIALCVVVVPWVIRNYAHSGRVLLFSTYGGGYHLLLMYNPYNLNPRRGIYHDPGYISEDYPGWQEVVAPQTMSAARWRFDSPSITLARSSRR